jgi:hypothetical protein
VADERLRGEEALKQTTRDAPNIRAATLSAFLRGGATFRVQIVESAHKNFPWIARTKAALDAKGGLFILVGRKLTLQEKLPSDNTCGAYETCAKQREAGGLRNHRWRGTGVDEEELFGSIIGTDVGQPEIDGVAGGRGHETRKDRVRVAVAIVRQDKGRPGTGASGTEYGYFDAIDELSKVGEGG